MASNPLNLSIRERVIFGSVYLLGVILDFGSNRFIHNILPIGRDLAVTWGLLRISGNVLMSIAAGFLIFRLLIVQRQNVSAYKRNAAIAIFMVVAVFYIATTIWQYKVVMNTNEYFETNRADISKSILKKMNQNVSSEKKSKLSYLHATTVYTDEGRIIEFVSPDGKLVKFTPSAEDQSIRNLVLFQKTQSEFEKLIAIAISFSWLLSIASAFLMGFGTKNLQNN